MHNPYACRTAIDRNRAVLRTSHDVLELWRAIDETRNLLNEAIPYTAMLMANRDYDHAAIRYLAQENIELLGWLRISLFNALALADGDGSKDNSA